MAEVVQQNVSSIADRVRKLGMVLPTREARERDHLSNGPSPTRPTTGPCGSGSGPSPCRETATSTTTCSSHSLTVENGLMIGERTSPSGRANSVSRLMNLSPRRETCCGPPPCLSSGSGPGSVLAASRETIDEKEAERSGGCEGGEAAGGEETSGAHHSKQPIIKNFLRFKGPLFRSRSVIEKSALPNMSGSGLLVPPSQAGRLSRPDSQILTHSIHEEESTGGAAGSGDRHANEQPQQQEYYEREAHACSSSTTSRHMNGGGPVRKLSQKIKQKFRNLTSQNRDRDDCAGTGTGTGQRGHFGSHSDLRGGGGAISGSTCALDRREDVERGDFRDGFGAGVGAGGADGDLMKRRSKLKKQLTFSGSSNAGRDYRRERAMVDSRTDLPNTVSMRDLQLQQQLEQAIGCDNRRDRRKSMVPLPTLPQHIYF